MFRELIISVFILSVLLAQNVVSETAKGSALQAIEEAESVISEMQGMGFGVTYANDTLSEAKLLFEQDHYIASVALAQRILEIREKAIKVNELVDEAESRIYDMSSKGYNVSGALALFNSGLSEFKLDNYIGSEKLMNDVLNKLDEIEAEESIKRAKVMEGVDYISLFLDYLWFFITLFLAVFILGLKYKHVHDAKKCKNRLKNLEKERDLINKKLKEVQRNYFERGGISKIEYEITAEKYNERLVNIKKESSILKERLSLV